MAMSPGDWFVTYAECVQQQLPGYTDQGIVNTAASCYKLLLQMQQTHQTLSNTSGQQQQQLRQVCATLQQLLGVVLAAAAGRVQTLPPAGASALIWASAGMHSCQQASPSEQQPQQQQQQHWGQGVETDQSVLHNWLLQYLTNHMGAAAAPAGTAVAAAAASGTTYSDAAQQHQQQQPPAAKAEVLQLLWLSAKLGSCPASPTWLSTHLPVLQQQLQLQLLSPGQTSQLAWSLAQLLETATAPAAAAASGIAAAADATQHEASQQQQQQQQQLSGLAVALLQALQSQVGNMNNLQLLEATASSARIVAALHKTCQPQLQQQQQHQDHHQQQQQEAVDMLQAAQHAASCLVPALAAAAVPLTPSAQPQQLLVLAQAFRTLLKHLGLPHTPSRPAAAAAAAVPSSAAPVGVSGVGPVTSPALAPIHSWLEAAARHAQKVDPPAAAVQLSMYLLAVGQVAVRLATRSAAAAAGSSDQSEQLTAMGLAGVQAQRPHPQQQQQQQEGLRQHQQHQQQQQQQQPGMRQQQYRWYALLDEGLSHVGQLQGQETLDAAALSVRWV
jgi:hypothetical protein